jgi:hypothetical protein
MIRHLTVYRGNELISQRCLIYPHKPGIDCARQTRSFVYALITVFVSSIEARQPRAAVDRRRGRNTGTPEDRLN